MRQSDNEIFVIAHHCSALFGIFLFCLGYFRSFYKDGFSDLCGKLVKIGGMKKGCTSGYAIVIYVHLDFKKSISQKIFEIKILDRPVSSCIKYKLFIFLLCHQRPPFSSHSILSYRPCQSFFRYPDFRNSTTHLLPVATNTMRKANKTC